MASATLAKGATVVVALAACGPAPAPRPTVPEDIAMVPTAEVVDRGELILRSKGREFGREEFTMTRQGDALRVETTARSTFPERLQLDVDLVVDPSSWRLRQLDVEITRDGEACVASQRVVGDVVELEVEYPDGERLLVEREPRARAEYFLANRPTITQTAICARADDQPHELHSFAPYYIVRIAPRAPSELGTAAGTGALDLVRVDGLIDVYCDGPRLAIVHYARHAFVAARAEYDEAATRLAADDPTDQPWAGTLGCPPR